MKRTVPFLLSISVCLFALACLARAQEIYGTVTDPSTAVVSGATVRLTSHRKVIATASTGPNGRYLIHTQQPCTPCQLQIDAATFSPFSREVSLIATEPITLSVRLEVAVVNEHVNVDAKGQPFVDQLDMSEVRDSPAKDVGEALGAVDGVYKIRHGGVSNDIVVRGFHENNLSVLVDGARIFGACSGHMDPAVEHVDFSEVERVELVKGAFDVENAGSLGATVNVVTKTPPLGLHLTPSFSFGSFGFYNPSVTASSGNNTFRALAGYSYRVSDPYKDGSGKTFLAYNDYSAIVQNKKAFEINTGWLETEFSPTDKQKLSFAYTRQQSGLVLSPYETMDSDYDHADRMSLKYEIRDLSSSLRVLQVQTYFTQVIHSMSDDYRTSAGMSPWMMAADARSRTIGGRVTTDRERDLTLGIDGYYRNWNMMSYMNMIDMITSNPSIPDVDTSTFGAFGDYHHSFSDQFKFTGGVRFDHDTISTGIANLNTDDYYNYQRTRHTRITDNYASGNVRLSYSLPNSLEVFVGLGSNGRAPDAEERFIDLASMAGTNGASMAEVNVGNPDLPIVRNTESGAGVIFRRGSSFIKPTLFFSDVSNYVLVNNQPLLTMAMDPASARSYTNVNAHIYGGEVTYAFALPQSFSLTGGTSYSKGTSNLKPANNVLDSNLPEMPPLRTWAALRYVHRYAFAELGVQGVARQRLVDTDLQETQTAGYGLLHAKLGLTYHKLNATFMVDNLLNRFYYEHLSYYRDPFSAGDKIPEPGRNAFGQLKYSF
jgi:iron complex outermembrane receptor protein